MYDGKQVLRFVTNYKSKDLYNIGNEMINRQGTGNYDKERTKFNIHYKDIDSYNLYHDVKQKLENNNIEYLNKTKTNMLNGVTITSGPEFFRTLGMEFKETGRYYQSGEKKRQAIMCPDIKDKKDIPYKVEKYFDYCYEFLKEQFGEENIVMAQVHYDEDTPHLQAYFLPVVNEVKRKSYVKDDKGNVIKEVFKGKDGIEKLVPKLKRDSNNKIIYENVKGKFLNNDQFWKDLGGKDSYAKLQNKFNKYINDKGYRLDRGQIGTNKVHQDKLDYQLNQTKAELSNLKDYIKESKEELDKVTSTLKNELNKLNDDDFNVKKTLNIYKNKDVEKLIDTTKELKRLTVYQEYAIKDKENENLSLKFENEYYKNNKELIRVKQDNNYKNNYIREKDSNYNYLKKAFEEVSNALANTLHISPKTNIYDYIKLAKQINSSANKETQEQFSKLFESDKEMEI